MIRVKLLRTDENGISAEVPLDDGDPATIEIARILTKRKFASRAEIRRVVTAVCDRHGMDAEFIE